MVSSKNKIKDMLPVRFVYVEDDVEKSTMAEVERKNYIDELNKRLWKRG